MKDNMPYKGNKVLYIYDKYYIFKYFPLIFIDYFISSNIILQHFR